MFVKHVFGIDVHIFEMLWSPRRVCLAQTTSIIGAPYKLRNFIIAQKDGKEFCHRPVRGGKYVQRTPHVYSQNNRHTETENISGKQWKSWKKSRNDMCRIIDPRTCKPIS